MNSTDLKLNLLVLTLFYVHVAGNFETLKTDIQNTYRDFNIMKPRLVALKTAILFHRDNPCQEYVGDIRELDNEPVDHVLSDLHIGIFYLTTSDEIAISTLDIPGILMCTPFSSTTREMFTYNGKPFVYWMIMVMRQETLQFVFKRIFQDGRIIETRPLYIIEEAYKRKMIRESYGTPNQFVMMRMWYENVAEFSDMLELCKFLKVRTPDYEKEKLLFGDAYVGSIILHLNERLVVNVPGYIKCKVEVLDGNVHSREDGIQYEQYFIKEGEGGLFSRIYYAHTELSGRHVFTLEEGLLQS